MRLRQDRFFSNLINNRELLVVVVIGFVSLVITDILSVQRISRDQKFQQVLIAERVRAEVQSVLEEHVIALTALNVVYVNFVDINAYDFEQYGRSISRHLPGYNRIFYVNPTGRIEQVYPLSRENQGLYGFDFDQPRFNPLFKKARVSHRPVLSGFLDFGGKPNAVLAIMPIYRGDKEFLGYGVGELSFETLWDLYGHADFLDPYLIQVEDSQGTPFFQGVKMEGDDFLKTSAIVKVMGSRWTVTIQPLESTYRQLLTQRVILWTIGLMLILTIVVLLVRTRRHKRALGKAQQQFQTMVEASPDGIMLLDNQLRIQITNPALQEWTHLDHEDLENQGFFEVFECECPHLAKCRDLSFLLCTSNEFHEPLPNVLEVKFRPEMGQSEMTLRMNAARIVPDEPKGLPGGFICLMADMSARKALEQDKETYIATLTHDLRTPLLAQSMVLENLLSESLGEVNPAQRKMLQGAHQSVRDLLEMVHSTLLYYQIESSHLALSLIPSALPELLREVSETLKPIAENRQIVFSLTHDPSLPSVPVDSIQMKRVFHNLMTNAINYGFKGTSINIQVTQPHALPGWVMVTIANQGKGIPQEDLSRIFNKYFSLSRKFKQIGTGLGLYIANRIVELHGGQIQVDSDPDGWTTFTLMLQYPITTEV